MDFCLRRVAATLAVGLTALAAGCDTPPVSQGPQGGQGGTGGARPPTRDSSAPTPDAGNGSRDATPAATDGSAVDAKSPPPAPGSDASPPSPPTVPPPPSPDQIALTALGANGTVGLDWTRDSAATGYRIYWSTTPNVNPATAQKLDSAEPSFVHRGLTNGTRYHYKVAVVTAAGEAKLSNEVMATPGGEWVLEVLGSGDFDDIETGARVPRLPIERRVQVLLLAEGYLAGELPVFHDHAGHNLATPTNDVDRWIKEVFDLEPYSKLREGFVIWYLPRASATHIDGMQSAFAMPAPALWTTLDGAGPDAFAFPPTAATRNVVASFLLFDPARGRAGVSGRTTSCPNPADRNLTVPCAFGIGHAHEFTHAFSSVSDEYLEDMNTRTGPGNPWSNVSGSNRCAEVPWAHLLPGAGINTGPAELVGAFGRPERGYHSELKCQMNGTHENGSYWCAAGDSLTLRVNRFCNFCRELTVFRLLFRTGILTGTNQQAFSTWASRYRQPFFRRFGFSVPMPVPQTLRCPTQMDRAVYEACVP
jgi:hypothetical protein